MESKPPHAIFRVSPQSQIIFLSQHDSPHLVNEALKTGAHGYVVKVDAASELLQAIRIVREGTRFVSERFRPTALELGL